MAADKFLKFLDDMPDSAIVESARQLYKSIFENNFRPLTVPDSMHQSSPFMDYKGMMKQVGTANGTSAPDNLGVDKIQNTLGRCTRDTGEETRNSKWSVPKLMTNSVKTSKPIKDMIKMANEHLPNPMVMGVPYSTQPMVTGFTVNSNWTNKYTNGVDVGSAGGGASSSGGTNAG